MVFLCWVLPGGHLYSQSMLCVMGEGRSAFYFSSLNCVTAQRGGGEEALRICATQCVRSHKDQKWGFPYFLHSGWVILLTAHFPLSSFLFPCPSLLLPAVLQLSSHNSLLLLFHYQLSIISSLLLPCLQIQALEQWDLNMHTAFTSRPMRADPFGYSCTEHPERVKSQWRNYSKPQ